MPATWWLKKGSYFLFMMREFSSIFIAAFVLLFMYELFLLSEGAGHTNSFGNRYGSQDMSIFRYRFPVCDLSHHHLVWSRLKDSGCPSWFLENASCHGHRECDRRVAGGVNGHRLGLFDGIGVEA